MAGACTIEVMPARWFVPCYWRLAGQLGLRYHMYWSEDSGYHDNVRVKLARVLSTVKQCLGVGASVVAADGRGRGRGG